jgi:hypothetical protein
VSEGGYLCGLRTCPSCQARTCQFICWREAACKTAPGRRSGSQEDATSTSVEEGKTKDEGDGSDLQAAAERGIQVLLTRGATDPWDGIQEVCS